MNDFNYHPLWGSGRILPCILHKLLWSCATVIFNLVAEIMGIWTTLAAAAVAHETLFSSPRELDAALGWWLSARLSKLLINLVNQEIEIRDEEEEFLDLLMGDSVKKLRGE